MMQPELRKDYMLERWTVISESRGKRPKHFDEPKINKKECQFCPGHEKHTPKEVFRIEEEGKWKIRVFPNKYPAFSLNVKKGKKLSNSKFFKSMPAFGKHEVVVETNDHEKQLADLTIADISQIFWVYNLRIKELMKEKEIKYVQIVKNHGPLAGTSVVHSHSQLFAYNMIPAPLQKKIKANKEKCKYCSIIKKEMKSKRTVFDGKYFAAFCPYAPRSSYEIWFLPKRHVTKLDELKNEELLELSKMLKTCLGKINKNNWSYNYYLNYAPEKENLHLHIELLPRLGIWGGFELATDITINSVSPESAAKFYRGDLL
jgi:UDPglucose--hexose-1-phosphate uridylyltransferase